MRKGRSIGAGGAEKQKAEKTVVSRQWTVASSEKQKAERTVVGGRWTVVELKSGKLKAESRKLKARACVPNAHLSH